VIAAGEATAEVADESSDLVLRALGFVGYLGHGRPTPGTDTGRVRISPVRDPLASRSRLATWPSAGRHSTVRMNRVRCRPQAGSSISYTSYTNTSPADRQGFG